MKKILLVTVLITYCGILETKEETSVTECRTQQYSVEGLPTWLLLSLPINLREEKSYVYVKRLARNGVEQDVIVLDGTWNIVKNDVDITLTKESGGSYVYGGFYDNETLLLFITKMSPFHEGTYEVETNPQDASKRKSSFCNLTMTPAGKEPDTSPDLGDKKNTSCTPTVKYVVEKSSNSNVCTNESFSIAALSGTVTVLVCLLAASLLTSWRQRRCYNNGKTRKDEHDTTKDDRTPSSSLDNRENDRQLRKMVDMRDDEESDETD